MAEPVQILGHSGGDFNAGTVLRYIPLRALYNPSTANHRGTRKMIMYTKRYDPLSLNCHIEPLESLVDVRKHKLRQNYHFEMNSKDVVMSKQRMAFRHNPHRTEYGFFMSGHSTSLHKREMLSRDNMERLMYQSLPSENVGLYLGNISTLKNHKPNSRAYKRLKESVRFDEVTHQHNNNLVTSPEIDSVGGSDSVLELRPLSGSKVVFITQGSTDEENQLIDC